MPITIICTKPAGDFAKGKEYIASKKTYVEGYNVREVGSDFISSVFGAHMNESFEIETGEGVAEFEPVKGATHD